VLRNIEAIPYPIENLTIDFQKVFKIVSATLKKEE